MNFNCVSFNSNKSMFEFSWISWFLFRKFTFDVINIKPSLFSSSLTNTQLSLILFNKFFSFLSLVLFDWCLCLSFFINFLLKFLRKWKLSLNVCLRRLMRLSWSERLFITVNLKWESLLRFVNKVDRHMNRMRNFIIIDFCKTVTFIWYEVCVLNKILLLSALSWKYYSSSYFGRVKHSFNIGTPILIMRLLWVNRCSVWTFMKWLQTTFSRKRHY